MSASSDASSKASVKKRWRRRLALGLLAAPVVVLLLSWGALGTDAGRRFVIDEAAARLQESTGWQLRVGSSELDLGTEVARLELAAVELGVPGGPPMLRLERARAAVELRALVAGELVLRELALEAPHLDLGSPRPAPSPEKSDSAGAELPLEIEAWKIERGAVDGALGAAREQTARAETVEGEAAGEGRETESGWLADYALRDLEMHGSLGGGALEATLESGRLLLERSADGAVLPVAATGRLRGPLRGPWTVDRLELAGDVLDAHLSGTFGAASTATFRARLDPSLLVPEIEPGQGEAVLDGRFSLPSGEITLDAEARGFPLAVLRPFLGESALAALGELDRLDVDAELQSVAGELEKTTGRVELAARRGELVVLRGELGISAALSEEEAEAAVEERSGAEKLLLDGALQLLPEEPGLVRAEARLVASSWAELGQGLDGEAKVREARLELRQPELERLTARLRELWPRYRDLFEWLPRGDVRLAASASGPLRAPAGEFDLRLRPPAGGELRLDGELDDDQAELLMRLELDGIDPSRLDLPLALPPAVDGAGAWRGAVELAASASRARIEADVRSSALEIADEAVDGAISATDVRLEALLDVPWHARPLSGPRLDRPASGRVELRAADFTAAAASAGRIDARLRFDGELEPSRLLRDGLHLDAELLDLQSGELAFPRMRLELASREGELRLSRIEGLLAPPAAVDIDQLPFRGSGQVLFKDDADGFALSDLRRVELELDAGDATRGVAAVLEARLDAGSHRQPGHLSLRVPTLRIEGAVASGTLRAEVPLATLFESAGLRSEALETLAGSSVNASDRQPVVLVFDLASVDLRGFERWSGGPMPAARGDLRGLLRFDPEDPTAAVGRLALDGAVERPEGTVETTKPLALRLDDRRVELRPARLRLGEERIDVGGRLALRPAWRLGDPVLDLVEDFKAEAAGAFDAALLDDYVPDCRMEGVLSFSVAASGDLDSYRASVSVSDGGDAAFTWDRPYVTRLAAPSAEIHVDDGGVFIDSARAEWNEGDLSLSGRVGEKIDLRGELEQVRYRLDYGLTVETRGTFHYSNTPSPGKLEADIVVDRGTLRRRIFAGKQLLDALLAPPTLERGGGSSEFGATELAIRLSTEDGVRVKNNLADLRVGWAPVRIEGNLAQPRILGTFEADPDGRVYAYGQVIRLDRAALIFSGAPAAPPRLDLQVTTSLEDPSLLTPEDQRVLASLASSGDDFSSLDGSERSARVRESVASGLTTYFGDQLASRLGRALGRTQLRYRPLWIFGEADPEARLVLSRDVSRYASVGVAFDLRQADEQTYLLEIGRLPRLPRFTGTLFSNDETELGATFQQQITFGGSPVAEEENRPRLAKVKIRCPTCRDRGRGSALRAAERALAGREGRPIDPAANFDLEIEIGERLRREGYPDPRVEVELTPAGDGRVELEAVVEPGPRAEFVFRGEEPPRSRRETLRDLYRSDYSERASLAEIEATAERVWRSEGHPWPKVTVEVEASSEPAPAGTRTVTITSEPGESFELEAPTFSGLPADVAEEIQGRFLSQQSRAELVAGEGDADSRLLDALAALGYPRAQIEGRTFDAESPRPRLTIDAGPRRHLASIDVRGAPAGEEERLAELISVEAGDPLVGAELASAAFAVERSLRQRGWIDARVRLEVPAPPPAEVPALEAQWAAAVVLDVEAGVRQRLTEVEIRGAEVTKEAWVERLAGVEQQRGELLDATQLTQARRELLETRLFDRVQVDVETDEAGEAVLRLDLRERPRYLTGYGLRWEESDGFGALFDILDRNAGGRGIGLGLRALWLPDRRSLRLYSQFPRLFNSPLELELFVEGFDEDEDGLLSDGYQVSGQLKWPLDERTELRSYVRYRRADVRDERQPEVAASTESVPLVGFSFVHDRRDDPFDPRRGFFASADLSGSENVITSDRSYLRLFAQIDHFLPLGKRWTWAQGARVGHAEVFDGDLPRDVRFFAGGARSLRGYASRSVGPRESLSDGTTRAAGGEALLILHEELRVDVSDAFQGVLFFDIGNVWQSSEDLGEELLSGAGLGVRYRSPIGLLRLDLAHPFDRENGGDDVEVYFGLGHAF